MATTIGIFGSVGGCGSASASLFRLNNSSSKKIKNHRHGFMVSCKVADPYKTLRIQPGASESDVKKAYRKLALKYHPDVCKLSSCSVQFQKIHDAYDTVMNNLRDEARRVAEEKTRNKKDYDDESMYEPDSIWEEWMGWEGAGIFDYYSAYVKPYIFCDE